MKTGLRDKDFFSEKIRKLAAIRAGLGWQGKHSLLISKKYGTFLALGGIITNADFEHNNIEESNRCRTSDKCQKACPLATLDQPYVLNVKNCMLYLLQNENLPKKVQIVMENRSFACVRSDLRKYALRLCLRPLHVLSLLFFYVA